MNAPTSKIRPGEARCPAVSTQEIVARDAHPAPGWIRSESYEFLGDEDISTDRYIEADFARKEYQRMWPRTWQFACREEHVPEPGDYHVYEVGPYSFIITRVSENEIKAYYNACLHRGTKLRASGADGNAKEFRCSFHGWTWNVDGSFKHMLCEWDFPHVDHEKYHLPEAKVETFAGFVWINMDLNAPPLREYMGEAYDHVAQWKLEDRYVHLHMVKHLPCNWKLAVEAFHESYHVLETHKAVAISTADANSQYDVYGDHVSRFIAPMGCLSPHLAGKYTEQDILDQFTVGDAQVLGDSNLTVPEGGTARQVMADTLREVMTKVTGSDLSKVSDSEMIDCFSYSVFPNMYMFPGISLPMVYRFRPDPKDHAQCYFDLIFLRPYPEDGSRPDPADPVPIAAHESYGIAEGMDPGFGAVLDQDTDNVSLQQEGIAASAKRGLTLGNYQEIRVRQFERSIDKYVAMEPVGAHWPQACAGRKG
jgi:nitrite reductase/ring-hydroxylating ferredoxin subunit